MKQIITTCLALLSFAILFSQKGNFTFQYNGNIYTLAKGTKIQLGVGSKFDGSFRSIVTDEVITQSENFNTGRRGNTATTTSSLRTGNKKYLGGHFSNKSITIRKVKYYKKLDEYEIRVFTTDGLFTLHIEDGLTNGEIKAIDGVNISYENSNIKAKESKKETNQTRISPNQKLPYILYLKNGSEIKCKVLEMKPNDFIKIQTADESIFVFKMDEVEELKQVNADFTSEENDYYEEELEDESISSFNQQTSSFEIVNSKSNKEPLGVFYNSTMFFGFIPNGTDERNDYTVNLGGFGFNNSSGYLIKDFLFLGGGLGFHSFFSNREASYHFFNFNLNQQIFALGKKKITPMLSLTQNFGSIITNLSPRSSGAMQHYGFDVGVRMRIADNHFINLTLGYSFQIFERIRLNENFGRRGNAYYLGVNLGYSFKK